MLADDGFAMDRLLCGKRGALGDADLRSILFSFAHALADACVEIGDFFLGLLKSGFVLFKGSIVWGIILQKALFYGERNGKIN